MATFNKFNAFVEALAEKVHDLGSDQLAVALTAVAPSATNSVLADLTQISYANLSSRNIVTTSSAQTSGTYKLTLQDLTLTATGTVAAFRYVAIFNDTTASKNLIGWYDYGSNVTLNSGETFTIDFDSSNGALTIA